MKSFVLSLTFVLFAAAAANIAGAATIHVSTAGNDATGTGAPTEPYATIQKAVDASQNGDLILVAPGTYSGEGNRAINLRGKQVTLRSATGPISTIIDLGQQQGVLAHSTETLATAVDGFTFQNGYVESGEDWRGDGIVSILGDAAITLRNCIFRDNETRATYVTTTTGIVVKRDPGTKEIATVENCLFYNNTIGGGGWVWFGAGGQAVVIGGCGAGAALKLIDVVNSTIANNTLYSSVPSWDTTDIGIRSPVKARNLKNTIVWGNVGVGWPSQYPPNFQTGAQTFVEGAGGNVSYSISQNGFIVEPDVTEANNLSADPLFKNPSMDDFSLSPGSPAIDGGDPSGPLDPDGTRADMGFLVTRFESRITPLDTDGDGVNDYREQQDGTDPNDPESFNPLSKGLVAYYPLQNSYVDESGFENNLADPSPEIFFAHNRFGEPASSLNLVETQDGVRSSARTGIIGAQANSISFWFYADQIPEWNNNYQGTLITIRDHLRDSYNVGEEHRILIDVYDGSTRVVSHGSWSDFYAPVPNGSLDKQWHHLLIVFDGSLNTSAIYLNGARLNVFSVEGYNDQRNMANGFIHFGKSRLHTGSYADGVSNTRLSDVRIYNRSLDGAEAKQLFYLESLNAIQRGFVENEPGVMGHYSQAEYEINRSNGRADVTTNPAEFNLFTQAEFDGNRTAGQQDILANPMAYGLYDSNSIMDLRMGGLMFQRQGTDATIVFQPQTTTDLATQPFTNHGTPITNTVTMPENKGFLRIQAQPE